MERVGFINEGDSNNLEKESPPEEILISTEDETPWFSTFIEESNMYMEQIGFINEGDSSNIEKESPPEDILISTDDERPEFATSEKSDNENQLSEITQSEEAIVEYEIPEFANCYSSEEESDVSGVGKAIEKETDKIHEERLAEETVTENVVMTTEVVMENSIEVEAVEDSTAIKTKMCKLFPKVQVKKKL